MEEEKEKKTASAFKPQDGGLFPQRQKPSPAAERAAKAAVLRSRLSVDSPRANSLGRGSFLRGGRSLRAGRSTGAATATKLRSTALSGLPQAFAFGQRASAKAASGHVAEATEEGTGADKGDQAAENSSTQKQVPGAAPGGPSGRLQSNALFNITAHLGLGGPGASRALPPSRGPVLVHGLTKPARTMRPEARPAAAAATSQPAQPNSTGDEEADEMTEEQIQAERRAALTAMPTFGGGLTGSVAAQQSFVAGSESGQQGSEGGGVPKSSFSFGVPAASAAAGQSAPAPQAGAPSAWPSLIRTQPASTDASAFTSQQPSPASVFGRLAAGGASAIGHPVSQQVPNQQDASQPGDAASAKVRRSQRFGSNLEVSAGNSLASAPQISGPGEDISIMEDDGEGALTGTIVGTCEDMCPHAEIVKRCNIEDVPVFERADPRAATTNTALAVKKFSRNVEQTPENFRTLGALRRTMMHLRNIMDRRDMPLVNIHKYLWDRFRGVRQDLFVQGIEGPEAIVIYEEHIRFMIMAEHELSEETSAAADQEAFNSHLNLEQINKALISLNAMYDKQRCAGQAMPCEAEFRAYHLLTLIGTHGRYRYDATEYQGALAGLSEEALYSEDVQRVVSMQQHLESGNWAAFLQLATNATYLQGCLAHMYFQGVRARALNVIVAAGLPVRGSDPPAVCIPAGDLQHTLYLNSPEDVMELSEKAELATDDMMDSTSFATSSVYLPKTLRIMADSVPRKRCHAISAKADELRSTVSQGLQGLSPEELQARQLRQQQLQQHLAQQQAQRLQEQQEMQARAQQEQQRQRAEESARHAAELAARQKAAEMEAARQAIAIKEAELKRQQAEREQALLLQQREEEQRVQQEAARLREERRKAEEERQRQLRLEQQRQQQLRLEQERRAAELQAQQEAEEVRRREEARRQAELAARRREQDLLRKEEEERQRRAAALRRRQEEGLKAVAQRRRMRLARQAAGTWREAVRRAAESRERERRTLEALAHVHVGIRATPFRLHWPPDVPQERPAPRASTMQPAPSAAPSVDMRAAVGQTLSGQTSVTAEETIHWKLMILHYDGSEHVDAVFRLREELSHRSAGCDGHVLALERFTVPHEGPTGERLVSTAICDANKSVASEEAMHRALLGASAVLLLITDRDDPALVDRRLTALYAACRQKIPLLVLTTGIPSDAIAAFIQRLLSSQTSLADGVAAHKVLRLPESTSSAFPAVVSTGLQWLASEAPPPPALMSIPLREMVLQHLHASMQPAAGAAPSLQDTIAACNSSLDAATGCISEAVVQSAAIWGWPPPETCTPNHSIPAGWYHTDHQGRLKSALDSLRLPTIAAQGAGPAAGSVAGKSDGFQDHIREGLGADDAALQPHSALLSAFQQRLQALDVPQPLSAVVSRRSWPPTSAISSHETTFQLAVPSSAAGSAGSSIVRKRKGHGSLSDRVCPPRKSKAQGSPGNFNSSPGPSPSAVALMTPSDIFAGLPNQASSLASRPAEETMHRLQLVRRDLTAQMEANERLADKWICDTPMTAISPLQGEVQQSALSELRRLAERIEREVLKGMEAEVRLQLPLAKTV